MLLPVILFKFNHVTIKNNTYFGVTKYIWNCLYHVVDVSVELRRRSTWLARRLSSALAVVRGCRVAFTVLSYSWSGNCHPHQAVTLTIKGPVRYSINYFHCMLYFTQFMQ